MRYLPLLLLLLAWPTHAQEHNLCRAGGVVYDQHDATLQLDAEWISGRRGPGALMIVTSEGCTQNVVIPSDPVRSVLRYEIVTEGADSLWVLGEGVRITRDALVPAGPRVQVRRLLSDEY